MEIKNQSGDVIGKIQFQTTADQGEIQRIILDLAPGEGKGIYIADAVDNNFTQQTNYAARDWEADLHALREKLHPWKPRFPTDLDVQHIQLYYGFDNLTVQEIDEMIAESKSTGRNVIVRELKPNEVITGISLSYPSDRGSFHLQVFGTTKTRIHIPDSEDFEIESVNVRGHEGYYISDAGQRKLVWIEEDSGGKALQYEITGNDVSKAWVLGIAESMME